MADNNINMNQVPEGMRSAFETGLTQARTMFDQMISATERAMTGFESQAKTVQSSALDANRKMMGIAEANVSAALGLADRLVKARDVQEMMAAHQEFAREQMQRLGEQTRELTELARSAASQPGGGGPAGNPGSGGSSGGGR